MSMYWLLCLDQLTTRRRSLLVGDDEPSRQSKGPLVVDDERALSCCAMGATYVEPTGLFLLPSTL